MRDFDSDSNSVPKPGLWRTPGVSDSDSNSNSVDAANSNGDDDDDVAAADDGGGLNAVA